MASNKGKQMKAGILMLALMLCLVGCKKLSTYESTAEYIPANQVSDQVNSTGYETVKAYEDDLIVEYQTKAQVAYTQSRSLYWDNPQDICGEMLVSTGDIVKKGDVIATFQSSQDSEIQVMERKLAVQEAQASLNQTIQTYENMLAAKRKSLELLTGYEYQIANLELEQMQYEYAQQVLEGEYRVSKQQEQLDKMGDWQETRALVAPFDGKITAVNHAFQPGTPLKSNSPIVQISDLDSEVLAFQSSQYADDVKYLSQVTLTDPDTQQQYTGTIVSCPGVTGNKGSAAIIKVNEEMPEGLESTGLKTLNVNGYLMQKEKVTLVDSQALKQEEGAVFVYVLNENQARYKVYVTIGENRNNLAWVIDGLSPGQTVIIK